ncbi:MAG: ABC-2 transporter permease [Candidatus Delongbacteria bacterium]|nr:ABC-2 transporter permease [Candidatus Delongbacteria bacterium]
MFKLIKADIKVLGHRLWIIPLGVFLFIMMFSFIPYLDQVQQFHNWIFAILIPGLLTFELLREEQRNNTNNMLMTMPVSKVRYVYSKYLLIFGFVIIGFIFGLLSNWVIDILNLRINDLGDKYYFINIYYPSSYIFKCLLFSLPVYFFTKKIRISIIGSLVIVFLVFFLYQHLFFRLRYMSWYDPNDYIIRLFVIFSIATLIFVLIRFLFKSKNIKWKLNYWFSIILLFTVLTTNILIEKMNSISVYFRYKEKYNNNLNEITVRQIRSWTDYFNRFEYEILVLCVIFLILSINLIVINRISNNNFIQRSITFIMMPVILFESDGYINHILLELFRESMSYSHNYGGRPLFIFAVLTSSVFYFVYSAKTSIYLLKNNRTL